MHSEERPDLLDRLIEKLSNPDLGEIRKSREGYEKFLLLFERRREREGGADPETETQIERLKHKLGVLTRYEARLVRRAEALRRQDKAV